MGLRKSEHYAEHLAAIAKPRLEETSFSAVRQIMMKIWSKTPFEQSFRSFQPHFIQTMHKKLKIKSDVHAKEDRTSPGRS